MSKIKKLLIVVCMILVCVLIGGITAYLTDADSATNPFTIGGIATNLREDSWEMPDDVVPKQVVAKDPTVTNIGIEPQYIFLEVQVPYAVKETANEDGTKNPADEVQLFSLDNISTDWYLVECDTADTEETGYYTYIYAYGNAKKMTPLTENQTTDPLFTSVTYANVVEDENSEGDTYYINVKAYAIQTSNLNDKKSVLDGNNTEGIVIPSQVWNICQNQGSDLSDILSAYTVSFHANGGNGYMNDSVFATSSVIKLPENIFTKTGYVFSSWNTEPDGSGKSFANKEAICDLAEANGMITLYAQWEKLIAYNVEYISTSGTVLKTTTVSGTLNSKQTVVPVEIVGYTTPESQTVSWNTEDKKTITFTYKPITYTITYNANGGSISNAVTNYTIETETFSLVIPIKEKSIFLGWIGINGKEPETTVTIEKGSIGNKAYSASWSNESITY